MINKKYFRLLREDKRRNFENFIYERISKNIIDSIDLITLDFDKILEIGINEDSTFEYLHGKMNNSIFDRGDIINKNSINVKNYNFLKLDLEKWNISKNFYNLIYSNFFLHLTNNFENIISNVYSSLLPNGLFISTIPHVDNCYQLRNAMIATDLYFYNGVYQRHNPTLEVNNILALLKNNRFDIPVINTENIYIEYTDFNKLLNDVRAMKLSYVGNDKRKYFENKKYFKYLEKYYYDNYAQSNCVKLDIKFNIIIAWKN